MKNKNFSRYSKIRHTQEKNIRDVLKDFFSFYHIDVNLNEEEIKQVWREITGELIYKLTSQIYVQDKILYIKVSASALKQELMMVRTSLLERINDKLGEGTLKNIYIK